MDFINKSFYGVGKIILGIIFIIIFIRIIPFVVVAGVGIWAIIKGKNYFKSKKNNKLNKNKLHTDNNIYNEENPFNLSNKKVIDVEYENID